VTCAFGCDHSLEDCLCGCQECQDEDSGICTDIMCDGSCGLDHPGMEEEADPYD
jgi:hypothetical protein